MPEDQWPQPFEDQDLVLTSDNPEVKKVTSYATRRLAACTQAVVILRSTSYIATELNVLHLKSYEIQSNRCMCAIVPLIAYLGIDL